MSIIKVVNKSNMYYNGDCIEVLKELECSSVDLIFADAPYNIGKDFGNNSDKWKNYKDYLNWCYEWIEECFRVLKENGTFYIMTSTQYMPYLDIYISEKYNIVNRIVWTYDSSGVQAKNKFGSLYEPIIMCTKSKKSKYTFNSQEILVSAKTGSERKLIDYRKNPPQPYSTKKVPGNVWNFNRVRFRMAEYQNHPTQKPEELLKRIILASSNKGDIILDPFSGSFTTCKVANDLGRRCIGIELNSEYFNNGLKRCKVEN